jgi:tRNA-specific 2-thiouridylase
MTGERIIVAMSGGVDSTVAAHLLTEAGYRPVGVFLDPGPARPRPPADAGHDAAAASADARRAADALGIPLETVDASADFDRLVDHVSAEYGRGRTPNPCVRCNRTIKFARLLAMADARGIRCVATGHYARVEWEAGRWRLKRGLDREKDQSYFLARLAPASLERIRLPVGEMTKREVRETARRLALPCRDAPESQDVCFLGGSVGDLVRARRPDLVRPGPILDTDGRELGRHDGIVDFTIGQRRGLGVAVGRPRYVIAIRPDEAAVVIGPAEAAYARGLVAEDVVWHERPPAEPVRAEVQIRYRHTAAPAWVTRLDASDEADPHDGPCDGGDEAGDGDLRMDHGAGRAEVRFDEPQHAVTPGQAAVIYRDDRVLGGGWIAEALD